MADVNKQANPIKFAIATTARAERRARAQGLSTAGLQARLARQRAAQTAVGEGKVFGKGKGAAKATTVPQMKGRKGRIERQAQLSTGKGALERRVAANKANASADRVLGAAKPKKAKKPRAKKAPATA